MTKPILLREAIAEDYEALCELINQVHELHRSHSPGIFRAPDGPIRTSDFILNAIEAPEIGLFVAESEDALSGFVHVIIRDTLDIPILVPRRFAVVDSLAVRHEHRRRGIGRELMEKAHAWAADHGAESVELRVYAFNRPAREFYRELGYEALSDHLTKSLAVPQREG